MLKSILSSTIAIFFGSILTVALLGAAVFWFGKPIVQQFLPNSESQNQDANVLHIQIQGDLALQQYQLGINWLDETAEMRSPFLTTIASIYQAAQDENIEALFIEFGAGGLNGGMTDELLVALDSFKKTQKPIYGFATLLNYSSLCVATKTDSMFMELGGYINAKGLASFSNYYGKALEQFGIRVDVFKHGKFKSAPEEYSESGMSEFDSLQSMQLIESLHTQRLQTIASNRQIPVDSVRKWIDSFGLQYPEIATARGVIDGIRDRKAVIDHISAQIGAEVVFVQPKTYGDIQSVFQTKIELGSSGKMPIELDSAVVILPLVGEIIEGGPREGCISAKQVVRYLEDKCYGENAPKSIIVIWDSPGGSARGSEQIRACLERIHTRIPVSSYYLGLGASGAVLAACGTGNWGTSLQSIVGSIGIFALYPNFAGAMQKFHVGREGVSTSPYANLGDPFVEVSPQHRARIQREIDVLYDKFVTYVAKHQKWTYAQTDSIAQGRVYTGEMAQRLGLVPKTSTLIEFIQAQILELGYIPKISVWNIQTTLWNLNFLNEIAQFQNQALDKLVEMEIRAIQGNYAKMPIEIQE